MSESRMGLDPELKDIDRWVELFEGLTPALAYGVVGFLLLDPDTPLGGVPLAEAKKPGNIAAMKRWVQANFRTVL